MKKIIAVLLLTLSTSVFAWNNGYGYRGPVYVNNYNNNNGWVGPALVGVVVGAAIARPYYAPPAVVYAPPPVTYIPYNDAFRPVSILDGNCNCYRTVWVPANQ